MNIENAFVNSWETWDSIDTLTLQFGNCTINSSWFPEGLFAEDEEVSSVAMSLDGEFAPPCVEVYANAGDETPQRFDVAIIRSEELAELRKCKEQLAKYRDLVGNIESALPSGLESWLEQDQIEKYYETGEL